MPSNIEFVFKTIRGKTIARGRDINQLMMVVLSQVGFTTEQGLEIGDHIFATWKKEAEQIPTGTHSWRATDYRADYQSGMPKQWSHRGNDLVFALTGDKANAVELGWAPPKSSDWADGIGTYDGSEKDLRPWLLHSGHQQVRHAKPKKNDDTAFTVYRFLKFDAPALSEMLETTAQHEVAMEQVRQLKEHQTAMNDADRERILQGARKVLQHTARSSLVRDDSGQLMFRPLDLSEVPPTSSEFGQHYNWIYHRATMQDNIPFKTTRAAMKFAMNKAKFTVFRTITDSQQQKDRGLFFSRGIAPAQLISSTTSPVVTAARAAVVNVMSGKNADGSEKNGS